MRDSDEFPDNSYNEDDLVEGYSAAAGLCTDIGTTKLLHGVTEPVIFILNYAK